MTTYEYATMRGRNVLASLVLMLAPARGTVGRVLSRGWARVKPVAMTTLGLGCIVAGLFTVSVLAGLIGAGVSFFVIDWAARPDERRR